MKMTIMKVMILMMTTIMTKLEISAMIQSIWRRIQGKGRGKREERSERIERRRRKKKEKKKKKRKKKKQKTKSQIEYAGE